MENLSLFMQDTKNRVTKPNSRALRLLSNSLQELNAQKCDGDLMAVAECLNLSKSVIEGYLAGKVADLETGREIFTALRTIIINRENELTVNDHWLMIND